MHLCERYHLFSGWANWLVCSGQIGGCRVGKLVSVIIFFQGGQIGGCRVGKLVGVEWANWWVSSGQIGGCQSGQKKNLPTKKWAKEEFAHHK